jgi:hypothetical protein
LHTLLVIFAESCLPAVHNTEFDREQKKMF